VIPHDLTGNAASHHKLDSDLFVAGCSLTGRNGNSAVKLAVQFSWVLIQRSERLFESTQHYSFIDSPEQSIPKTSWDLHASWRIQASSSLGTLLHAHPHTGKLAQDATFHQRCAQQGNHSK
jgi:hypothetical protein